jgi:cation diffusion facilitator family transporter
MQASPSHHPALRVDELYRKSRRAASWGIAISLGLGLVKFLGGIFGHSFALVSDGVHSLGDAVTSTALLGALILSQLPADVDHPYGHSRAESVAGSSAALLLILSALGIIWESLHTLFEEYVEPAGYVLAIAGFSAVIKEGLFRYKRSVAQETGSSALEATAWDHRLDAMTSLAVLVGVALAKWGGPAWHLADHLTALLVAGAILVVGYTLFRNSLSDLMDRQADPEVLQKVREEASRLPGVAAVEKLRVRKTGLEYLVDIHVEVAPEMTVQESHAIGHVVKDHLCRNIPLIKDVLVHIEPALGRANGE